VASGEWRVANRRGIAARKNQFARGDSS